MESKRAEIIANLYQSPQINAAIEKIQPERLRDDLKQEMFLVLCEMPEAKFRDLYDKGRLQWYVVRTMLNMAMSNRSTFYNTFRRELPCEVREIEDGKPSLVDKVNPALDSLHFYEAGVLRLYAEHGSSVAVSRVTTIPERSIRLTVASARKKLKKILNNE